MKILILVAFGVAAFFALIGVREMDRTDTSPDVAVGGAIFVILGIGIAVLALIGMILVFLLGGS